MKPPGDAVEASARNQVCLLDLENTRRSSLQWTTKWMEEPGSWFPDQRHSAAMNSLFGWSRCT